MECSRSRCHAPVHAHNLCAQHYNPGPRSRAVGRLPADAKCSVKDCNRPCCAKTFCRKHYNAYWRYGDPSICTRPRRENGQTWTLDEDGYAFIKVDGEKQFEHRYVMEQQLGRKLLPGENVHHRNGVKTDNRSDNLELWSTSQPYGQRVEDKVQWAREILMLYGHLFEEHVADAAE